MKSKEQVIDDEFQKYGVFLKPDLEAQIMQESITNSFLKVKDIYENSYLVRINGKLWPPFTRENEDHNLKILASNKIDTSVLSNNIEQGFQICFYNNQQQNFTHILNDKNKHFILKKLSFLIGKYHRLKNFNHDLSLIDTLLHSFASLSEANKNIVRSYYPMILSILDTLNSDLQNKVSCHNDLLPSSIYIKGNNLSIVDWEYSGTNHRSYDLAMFSIKASLNEQQEKFFLSAYDPKNLYDTKYTVALMKPFIIVLLLQWNLSAKNPDTGLSINLQLKLYENLQKALSINAVRTLGSSHDFFFTQKEKNHAENISACTRPLMRAKL